MKDQTLSDDEDVEMTQRLLIREEPAPVPIVPCKKQIAKKTATKKSSSTLPAALKRIVSSTISTSNNTATSSPAPLPVNKTKARSMEDFFAQMLTERGHHK